MIKIEKTLNLGNTLIDLVMSAFNVKDQRNVKVDPFMQSGVCGTVEVFAGGKWAAFDWIDRSEHVEFYPAQ